VLLDRLNTIVDILDRFPILSDLVSGLSRIFGSLFVMNIDLQQSNYIIAVVCLIIAINDVWKKKEFLIIKREARKFIGHTFKVNKISLSSDGNKIVSGSDRVAIVWDTESSKPIQRLQCSTWVGQSVFIDNDNYVIGIGGKGYFFKWDVNSGRLLENPQLENTDSVAFAVSSTEKIVASASKNGEIHVWSYPDLKLMNTFIMGDYEIRKIALSPDDCDIVGCDVTGKVTKFSLACETSKVLFKHPDKEPIRYITYSFDGKQIAFIDASGQLSIFDLEGNRLILTKQRHSDMGL